MIYEPSLFTALIQDYLRLEAKVVMMQAFSPSEHTTRLARQLDRQYAALKYRILYPFADYRLDYGT